MTTIIRTAKDCRLYIGLVRLLEQALPKVDDPEAARAIVVEYKRAIRAYLGAPDTGRRIVKDYGIDGCIVRVELPEEVQTYLDAMEWFDACEHIEWIPGPYDCTGRAFTSWFRLFYVGGRYVCYHRIARDV